MKSIEQRLKENYILGCIRYKGNYLFYIMPVAWWILDYKKYDPSIAEDDPFLFRNGVYSVTDDTIERYLHSISEDEISLADVRNIKDRFTEEYSRIIFLIDFDKKEYTSGFEDIDVEDYLPNTSWTGKFDWDPSRYIPVRF